MIYFLAFVFRTYVIRWMSVHWTKSKLKNYLYHLMITRLLYRIRDLQNAAHLISHQSASRQSVFQMANHPEVSSVPQIFLLVVGVVY